MDAQEIYPRRLRNDQYSRSGNSWPLAATEIAFKRTNVSKQGGSAARHPTTNPSKFRRQMKWTNRYWLQAFRTTIGTSVTFFDFFKAFMIRCQGIRGGSSAALDLCYLACGRLDGFWEWKLNRGILSRLANN